MDWEEVRGEFQWDGSLRDVYILDSNVALWQRLLDQLRVSRHPLEFFVDGRLRSLPAQAAEIFTMRLRASVVLNVEIAGVTLGYHFFVPDEIEAALDPREVDSEERYRGLLDHLRDIGRAVEREVRLTPENCPENPILIYSPHQDAWRYLPAGA